jgi:hypothetical protein
MRIALMLSVVMLLVASRSASGQNRPQRPFEGASTRRPSVSPYI